MPIRLPKAATKMNRPQDDLAVYAQNIHDGLLASIATFPTPPVLPAALQTLIDTYTAALAAAFEGSKAQTAAKNLAKLELMSALRVDAGYVNQIVFNLISGGTTYDDAQTIILETGYELSRDPTPAGPLLIGAVKNAGSFAKGQFSCLIERVPNAIGYQVKYAPDVVDAVTKFATFTNGRIVINGLTSGVYYTFELAAIGTNPTRTYNVQVVKIIT